MRNERYYKMMSKAERRLFRRNCEKHIFKCIMSDRKHGGHQFFMRGFLWAHSKEGHEYWTSVFERVALRLYKI